MLRPPYTRYSRIFVYHLDLPVLPALVDQDLIGAWREGETTVLFFHRPKDRLVAELCARHGCTMVYQADLDYQDWETGQEISSFTIGPLTVAPVWDPAEADIRLDPSVVFGNGFHPTTRLCLEALHQLLILPGNAINSAYDIGCGTGLLAIAAARLGVGRVLAIDENNLACKVARANVSRNRVEGQVEIRQLDACRAVEATSETDLIMANLYHGLLVSLFKEPGFWQARYYIISGFFSAGEETMRAALPDRPLRFLNRQHREKWGLWVLENSVQKDRHRVAAKSV